MVSFHSVDGTLQGSWVGFPKPPKSHTAHVQGSAGLVETFRVCASPAIRQEVIINFGRLFFRFEKFVFGGRRRKRARNIEF